MNSDVDTARTAAFAAVTAHLRQDHRTAEKILFELSTNTTHALSAMTALVHAASVATDMWARAIREEPEKAWQTLAHTVALVSTREDR